MVNLLSILFSILSSIVTMASDIVEELLNRVDIVEVIQRYVPLKRAGSNFSGCCPFHREKTPSFMVSSSKQIFKCFGCGI